jgi:hypothetical protein
MLGMKECIKEERALMLEAGTGNSHNHWSDYDDDNEGGKKGGMEEREVKEKSNKERRNVMEN